MRRTLIIVVVAVQVLILVFIAGKREFVAMTGTVVYLRTAPVDPRDIFRGDYVRLHYEASTVSYAAAPADVVAKIKEIPINGTIYSLLTVGAGGLAEVTGLAAEKPASGLFLKGRLTNTWRFGRTAEETAAVEYGIEAYYVQQGKGIEIERREGTRNTMQTPLEMEVAIGSDGTAVIRGYRWSPIGIGLEAIESPSPKDPQGRKSAKLKFTLKNTSQKPLGIAMLPLFCSLSLEPVSPGQRVKIQERPHCSGLTPTNDDVVLLQADEFRSYDIELTDRQWQVLKDSVLTETGTLDWSERFRIVYTPPSKELSSHVQHADALWHGRLPSRAFHGRGNVD